MVKMRGMLVTGVSAVVLVVGATSAAMAAPTLAKAPTPKASLSVSPSVAEPGASVMVTVTCVGTITDNPSSGALTTFVRISAVAASKATWKATVSKVNPGGYAVGFTCNNETFKDYLTVQKAATVAQQQVTKAPKGSVRTGGGGTAITVVDGGSGSGTSSGAGWAYHDPPRGLPRLAVTYVKGLHR